MEHSRARGGLPPALDGLLASQVAEAIREANLGRSDTHIAQRRYLDRLPQIDIAVELGLDRSTVSRRLNGIETRVSRTARKFTQ